MVIAMSSHYGQSGDVVEILLAQGKPVVRKSSTANPDRLRTQAEKQGEFQSFPGIKVPKILHDFENGSFTMEYCPGLPLGEFLTFAAAIRGYIRNHYGNNLSLLNTALTYFMASKLKK
jgi:hypothetical protein